jgi:hypothetical protein
MRRRTVSKKTGDGDDGALILKPRERERERERERVGGGSK